MKSTLNWILCERKNSISFHKSIFVLLSPPCRAQKPLPNHLDCAYTSIRISTNNRRFFFLPLFVCFCAFNLWKKIFFTYPCLNFVLFFSVGKKRERERKRTSKKNGRKIMDSQVFLHLEPLS
jgi:hypothetical protein